MIRFVYALVALVVAYGAMAVGKHFWRGETMAVAEAKRRWGDQIFDAVKFKVGDASVKAKMAASAVSDKSLLGKSTKQIRELLGNWDGYYFSDMFPAYIVQDGSATKGETWQLVFLLDRNYLTSEIIIHKNCCEK